jgi:predicted DsbA family dithiol-disulfide isomerase
MKLEVASDVICPWCYIGKRRLEKALKLLDGELQVETSWLPFQLNPGMPKEGMPRAEYRQAKFGSLERSRSLDARVIAEGKSEGIEFAFDRIERTPNTLAAHSLIRTAQEAGLADSIVTVLFRAYFEEAKDIGDPKVLAEIAAQCGVQGWPESARDVSALEEEVRAMGITAVPTFIFERRTGVSGAYPAEQLAAAIREAARVVSPT